MQKQLQVMLRKRILTRRSFAGYFNGQVNRLKSRENVACPSIWTFRSNFRDVTFQIQNGCQRNR